MTALDAADAAASTASEWLLDFDGRFSVLMHFKGTLAAAKREATRRAKGVGAGRLRVYAWRGHIYPHLYVDPPVVVRPVYDSGMGAWRPWSPGCW